MSLALRSAKYYLYRSATLLFYVVLLSLILVVEILIMDMGEPDVIAHALRVYILGFSMMVFMLNAMYALYGVSWMDSMVLSMGARRIDIFRGEILQNVVLLGGGFIVNTIVAACTNQMHIVKFLSVMYLIGLPIGALAAIAGHTLHKYGRIVIFILIFISAGCGGYFGGTAVTGTSFLTNIMAGTSTGAVVALSLLLYVVLEVIIYNLNKKTMVF